MNNKVTYFVDESGDFNLFNKKGYPSGGSDFIMLGLLKIKEKNFTKQFEDFKNLILSDSKFNTFKSIVKTQKSFHAKDDHIAVKREVFNFLKDIDISAQVIIRKKSILIDQASSQFADSGKKLSEKQIYNNLVSRLFKGNLHKANNYKIVFSHRTNSTENESLQEAIHKACDNLYRTHGIRSNSEIKIRCYRPDQKYGLQIIDYCLWALQRLYVKHEDVYFDLIKEKFKFIIDVDDKKNNPYGEYYNLRNRLTLEKIRG